MPLAHVASLLLTLGLAAPPGAVPADVRAYLATRDAYVRAFEKDGIDVPADVHQRALDDLARRIRPVIGPVTVPGLQGEGRINLESLVEGLGFGLVDGLRLDWHGDAVVVTTPALLDAWVRAQGRGPGDLPSLARSARFHGVLFDDAGIDAFADVPVTLPRSLAFASASLVLAAQDEGPWPPDLLVLAVARGERIFFVFSRPRPPLPQRPRCQAGWDALERERGARFDRAEAFAGYVRCYAGAIRGTPAFRALTARAQAIVDRLGAEGAPHARP